MRSEKQNCGKQAVSEENKRSSSAVGIGTSSSSLWNPTQQFVEKYFAGLTIVSELWT
jgi:hypothetical protein